MSSYRLVAIDLDGTLIDRRLTIAPRVQEAIRAVQERGVTVTLASGRMFAATLPFAQQLKITAPLICYQGALVRHPVTGETFFHVPVPQDLAMEVAALAKAKGVQVNAFVDDRLYIERLTPEAQSYIDLARVEPHFVSDLIALLASNPPTKLVLVNLDEGKTDGLLAELSAHFARRLAITKSYPFYTEVIHPDVSKGRALAQLARQLGIPQKEVLAIGDNLNDLSLVEYAGLGVAMGNAAPQVKAAADYVTATLEEDGVAQALELFILNQQ